MEWHSALKVISIPQNVSEVQAAYNEGMSEKDVTGYFKAIVEDISQEFRLMRGMSGLTNIVSCEDFMVIPHEDEIGWDILIRMELLTPLTDYSSKRPLTEQQIIRLGLDLCSALKICEDRGIIHRDIKPENIFVNTNGDFKLGDFGIARTIERTATMSQKGTYTYMAPEVYNGKQYGLTVDIYSLGMVLYWYLNENRVPFLPLPPAGILPRDRSEALRRRISGEPIPAPLHGSPRLKRAVLKALNYDPSDRFHSAWEFANELQQCMEDLVEGPGVANTITPPVTEPTVISNDESTTEESTQTSQSDNVISGGSDSTVMPENYGREIDTAAQPDRTMVVSPPEIKQKGAETAPHKSKRPIILGAAAGVVVLIGVLFAVLFLPSITAGADLTEADFVLTYYGEEFNVITKLEELPLSDTWYFYYDSSEDSCSMTEMLETSRGIHIGDSVKDVFAAYGKAEICTYDSSSPTYHRYYSDLSDCSAYVVYWYGDIGLIEFILDSSNCVSMIVYEYN